VAGVLCLGSVAAWRPVCLGRERWLRRLAGVGPERSRAGPALMLGCGRFGAGSCPGLRWVAACGRELARRGREACSSLWASLEVAAGTQTSPRLEILSKNTAQN